MQSKQKKQKNGPRSPSKPKKSNVQTHAKTNIPRNKMHTTSWAYVALKGIPKEEHEALFARKPNVYEDVDWNERGRLSVKAIKSTVKSPRVHRWKGIKSFGIDISSYCNTEIKSRFWKRINFSNFDHLRKFSFETNSEVRDRDLKSLAVRLRQSAPNLRQLSFVPKSGWITPEGLEKFIVQTCKSCDKLQDLNISLHSTQLSDQEKLKFALHNIIKKLSYLKQLKIRFVFNFHVWNPQIADALMKHIGLGFSNYFEQLQQLHFSLLIEKGRFDVAGKLDADLVQNPIGEFANQLGKLKCLQKLALCFKWNQVQDKDLGYLGHQIGEKLIHLTHLSLQFIRCDKLSRKGLKQLATGLCKGSANLQNIEIDFIFCGGLYPPDYNEFKIKLKKEIACLDDLKINGVKV